MTNSQDISDCGIELVHNIDYRSSKWEKITGDPDPLRQELITSHAQIEALEELVALFDQFTTIVKDDDEILRPSDEYASAQTTLTDAIDRYEAKYAMLGVGEL